MSWVDVWAVIALFVAGVALYYRGVMLKPSYMRWVTAPGSVWFALMVAGVICGGAMLTIFGGTHATGREAMVYSAIAGLSVVMLVNLARQRPQANVVREILAHVNTDLLVAPREVIGRAVDAVREAAKRAGFHA